MAQLCESCKNYAGKCPWTAVDDKTGRVRFDPIPGWTAFPSTKHSCGNTLETFEIVACPMYVPDDPRPTERERRIYAVDRIAVLNMLDNGYTTSEIADACGCSETTIYAIRRELRGAGLL